MHVSQLLASLGCQGETWPGKSGFDLAASVAGAAEKVQLLSTLTTALEPVSLVAKFLNSLIYVMVMLSVPGMFVISSECVMAIIRCQMLTNTIMKKLHPTLSDDQVCDQFDSLVETVVKHILSVLVAHGFHPSFSEPEFAHLVLDVAKRLATEQGKQEKELINEANSIMSDTNGIDKVVYNETTTDFAVADKAFLSAVPSDALKMAVPKLEACIDKFKILMEDNNVMVNETEVKDTMNSATKHVHTSLTLLCTSAVVRVLNSKADKAKKATQLSQAMSAASERGLSLPGSLQARVASFIE